MLIKLYKVTDSQDTIGKTMVNPLDIEVRLKSDFNILNPVVVLMIPNEEIRKYNYMHIPEFGRFYFVENITNINNRMFKVEFSCDVLETYKDNIKVAQAIYRRTIGEGDYSNISGNSQKWEFANYESEIELADEATIIVSTVSTK